MATIQNADGAVHIRIVTLALIAAIAISGFAISVRLDAIDGMQANMHASRVLKAQVPRRQPIATSFQPVKDSTFLGAMART